MQAAKVIHSRPDVLSRLGKPASQEQTRLMRTKSRPHHQHPVPVVNAARTITEQRFPRNRLIHWPITCTSPGREVTSRQRQAAQHKTNQVCFNLPYCIRSARTGPIVKLRE